eukprot:NODE_669_length_5359_cov_0.427376.p2 type:complete len:233 gc:universal NODE_669_length_5359_cov_0.427376:2180-1482(-)
MSNILDEYFQVYREQTEPKCPYHKPKLQSKLDGIKMNGMLIFDSKNYRRIYNSVVPNITECSVLYVDKLHSFDGIPEYTIVVAKQLEVTSPIHIVVTSELTSLKAVPLNFSIDPLLLNHYYKHTTSFYAPELLDLHAIDGFVPMKDMDQFVSVLDGSKDIISSLKLFHTYPGVSRLRIYGKDEIEDAPIDEQNLTQYSLLDKVAKFKELRMKEYACPYTRNVGKCPIDKTKE